MAFVKKRIELNGVELRKRNFRGEVTDMNERGNRQCLVVLSSKHARELGFDDIADMVNTLRSDGWVIKRFNVTEDNDDPDAYMPVTAVFYDDSQSMIFMKTAGGRPVLLHKDTVGRLDRADIENVDIIIEQHYYNSHGREGFNNRIKSMEVTIIEDGICSRNNGYSDREDIYDDGIDEELPFSNRQ